MFESSTLMKSGALRLVSEHPGKFAAAALAGFGVNGLAILVIKLASSLTLKVGLHQWINLWRRGSSIASTPSPINSKGGPGVHQNLYLTC